MIKKWVVVQHLAELTVLEIAEHGRHVKNMMTGNPTFASLAAVVTLLNTHVTALDAAISNTAGGSTKTDAIKTAKKTVVRDLDSLGNSVETIANATPDLGDVIIHSAGMEFKQATPPKPRVFEVKNGVHAGTVEARTKKGADRAIYEWRFKKLSDAEFTIAAKTLQANYTYTDLVSGERYQFCVETTLKDGIGDLSNVLDLIIL